VYNTTHLFQLRYGSLYSCRRHADRTRQIVHSNQHGIVESVYSHLRKCDYVSANRWVGIRTYELYSTAKTALTYLRPLVFRAASVPAYSSVV